MHSGSRRISQTQGTPGNSSLEGKYGHTVVKCLLFSTSIVMAPCHRAVLEHQILPFSSSSKLLRDLFHWLGWQCITKPNPWLCYPHSTLFLDNADLVACCRK